MTNTPPKPDPITEAVKRTVEYLYSISDDCPPELAQAIGTLRQLINEEFKPQKSVSSSFIYEILNPAIQRIIREARIEELENLNTSRHYGKDYQASMDELDDYKNDRLSKLKEVE